MGRGDKRKSRKMRRRISRQKLKARIKRRIEAAKVALTGAASSGSSD